MGQNTTTDPEKPNTKENPMSFNHRFRVQTAVKARTGEVLDNETLRRVAPSIFATEAHESRSHRFAPIATVDILDGLRKEGFSPVFAAQARTRDEGRKEFTKHMLRLRHEGDKGRALAVGDSVFEIVLINANDGTSAYHMLPGVFRLVCLNGMMVSEQSFEGVKVRHSGNAVSEVIEGAFRVLDESPKVAAQIESFQALTLSNDERRIFSEAAHSLRFPDFDPKAGGISAEQLLRPRRMEDRAPDLWTTLNAVQENVIRGGQSALTRDANNRQRRTTSREVQGIDQNKNLNRALWTLTEAMANLKRAA